jgi:hypothetical protein
MNVRRIRGNLAARATGAVLTTIPQALPTSQRIADLRREIEGIQELNTLYRLQRYHRHQDHVAHEMRQIRLEDIKQQLAALRSKRI